MPPREAKGRMLTREYMADADFQRKHDAATRELYMMLALFADDSGWLEWDSDYLSSSIYRYEPDRETIFNSGVESLVAAGRLVVKDCGHAVLPRVQQRPRPGRQERNVQADHATICDRPPVKRRRKGISPDQFDTPDQTRPTPDLTNTITNTNTITPRESGHAGKDIRPDRNGGFAGKVPAFGDIVKDVPGGRS